MRNVRALSLVLGVLLYSRSDAQCLDLYRSLESRTVSSSLVTEAKVISATTRWNEDHTLILTEYGLDVHKVMKGTTGASVLMVVTFGGSIGETGLLTSSFVPLQPGDYGLFFLNSYDNAFYLHEGQQSHIRYQQDLSSASDPFRTYTDIRKEIYRPIEKVSGQRIKVIKDLHIVPIKNSMNRETGEAGMDEFFPTTIAAGTMDTLTIKGEGFGTSRCSGCYVSFKNADSPNSSFQLSPTYYTTWSDTMIKLVLPGNGVGYTPGSGTFYVTNESGTQLLSPSPINIPYAALNNYVGGVLNRVSLINSNGTGGYTLTFDQAFAANTAALDAAKRAIQTWRCDGGINFEIAPANANITCSGKDGINSISFAKPGCSFPSTPLAQTMIWYTCKYIQEVDIVFSTNYTFDYARGSTPNSQYDFESVALHELGHAFGLGHTIGAGKVMHPILQNGAEIVNLSADNEISAATNCIAHSQTAVCSQGAYSEITGDCSITPPTARFDVNISTGCAPLTVQFNNTSTGGNTYAWDIDNNGTVEYTTANPSHIFTEAGSRSIKLTVTNSYGSSEFVLSSPLQVKPTPTLNISFTGNNIICDGNFKQLSAVTNTPMSLQWKKNGSPINGATNINYNASQSGAFTVTASAANCPTLTASPVTINVAPKPDAVLSYANDTLFCLPKGMPKYGWMIDDQYIDGENKDYIIAKRSGIYRGVINNESGCTDTTNTLDLRLTPVADHTTEEEFALFPNPAAHTLHIEISDFKTTDGGISIMNMMGANVYRQENLTVSKGDRLDIPVASLPPGMYVIRLEDGDQYFTRKFIKN